MLQYIKAREECDTERTLKAISFGEGIPEEERNSKKHSPAF